MRQMLIPFTLAAAILGFTGCSLEIVHHPEPPAGAREGFTFEDIPSPQNFAMDRFQTYGYIYTNFSVYTIVFHGNDRVDSIAQFYRSQMPIFGWEPKGDPGALTFENRHERCVVNIVPESRDSVTVKITRDLK